MVTAMPVGGRRSTQLRSAVHTVRGRRPVPHPRDGDPELIALVDEPYVEVAETHERLEELLAAFRAREDRRAVFLAVYAKMTGSVANRLRADGFDDHDWVGRYLVSFANLYREAVRDYERGDLAALPDPWQLAFDAADAGDSLVIQDLLLGVNAHINYDLSLAVNDAGVRSDRDRKYVDHSRVTDVIAAIMDDAQDHVVDEFDADGLGAIDESLGRLDEQVSVLTIDQCRDSAWRTAVALDSRFAARRRLARWINDVTATGAAHLILSTKTSDRLHDALVELERPADD